MKGASLEPSATERAPLFRAAMKTPSSQSARGLRLKLYIAGRSPRSRRAIDNLREIADLALGEPCEIELIDVLEHPEQAERERILATPTLLKDFPLPRRRITGDLSDTEQVLRIIAPVRSATDVTELIGWLWKRMHSIEWC
jgi:circadian clock protein KaiB